MDDVTKSVLEQSFVEMHKRSSHAAQRFADGTDNVAEQTRLGFLRGIEQVGTREAQAMQEVRTSAQAREILQARAAAEQPQKAVG